MIGLHTLAAKHYERVLENTSKRLAGLENPTFKVSQTYLS